MLQISVALQFGDQRQRFNGITVQVQNDQQRFFRINLLEHVLLRLHKLDVQASALGGVVDLDGKQEVVYHSQYFFSLVHIKNYVSASRM